MRRNNIDLVCKENGLNNRGYSRGLCSSTESYEEENASEEQGGSLRRLQVVGAVLSEGPLL